MLDCTFARPTNPLPHFSSVLLTSQYAENEREKERNETEFSHKKPVNPPTCFLPSLLLANPAALSSFVIMVTLHTGDNVLGDIVIDFVSIQLSSSLSSQTQRTVQVSKEESQVRALFYLISLFWETARAYFVILSAFH